MKSLLMSVILAVLLVIPLAANAEVGPVIAIGPGFVLAAQDDEGENERFDAFVDLGVRLGDNLSIGGRVKSTAWESSIYALSLWSRFDLASYGSKKIIPYLRGGLGGKTIDATGKEQDTFDLEVPFGVGFEAVSSKMVSLFIEGEAVYSTESKQLGTGTVRAGLVLNP